MRLRNGSLEPEAAATGVPGGGGVMARGLERGAQRHRRFRNTNDHEFLATVKDIIQEHLGDPAFDTSEAAQEMSISRMHLHRKLRAITGLSTRQYITARRLEKARLLLGRGPTRVCDVAGKVGFRSPSYFARAFARLYGIYPSELARRNDRWSAGARGGAEA